MSIRRAWLGLAALVALGGCSSGAASPHAVVTGTDQSRLAVMRADPALKTVTFSSASPSSPVLQAAVGEQLDKGSWRRGRVTANIYETRTPTAISPPPVQAFLRGVVAGMQSRGWVFYYAECDAGAEPAGWTNTVYAYRIDQGVSYWAFLEIVVSQRTPDGSGGTSFAYVSFVNLTMLVPAVGEPKQNLFPDQPLAIGSICAVQPVLGQQATFQGKDIQVGAQTSDSATGER